MLTREQRTLVENIIESLDRLFDRDSTVKDVHSLLIATAIAIRGSELAAAFDEPIRQLRDVVRSKALPDQKREMGLNATDGLRQFIAQQLLHDAIENPKRRHAIDRGGHC